MRKTALTSLSFRTKTTLVVTLLLATVLNYLDRQTISILAPTLQHQMGLNNEHLGWLFAIFYYSYTLFQFAVRSSAGSVQLAVVFCVRRNGVVSGSGD